MVVVDDTNRRITELEAAQKRSELIAHINAALSAATNEHEILSAVGDLAQEWGAIMSFLAYPETDENDTVIGAKLVAVHSADGTPIPLEVLPAVDFPLDANPILRIALENPGEPLFLEDMFNDPRTETGTTREVFRQLGFTAAIIMWFRAGGKWQGVMTFDWSHVQPFDADLRAIFKAIQPVAASTIANRRLMLRLEQEAEQSTREATIFKHLVENSLDSISMVSAQTGLIVYANEASHRIFGYDYASQEMIQLNGQETFLEEDLAYFQEQIFPASMQQGWSGEVRQRRKNGDSFEASATAFPMRDDRGNTYMICIILRDVTEQKRAEAEREHLQQQVIEAQRQALQELSTPIIPVMDGIIVMPLVGSIDSVRTRDIMRSLLLGISQHRAKIAILDITGVPVVDSGVADHLNRTIQAARLKGTQTIVTGISDAVAEAVVDLGIDWSEVETLRDLQSGLLVALQRLGFGLNRYETNGQHKQSSVQQM